MAHAGQDRRIAAATAERMTDFPPDDDDLVRLLARTGRKAA